MSALKSIKRFLIEFDEAMEHARTGRPPARLDRTEVIPPVSKDRRQDLS